MEININGFDCSVVDIDNIDTKTHYGFIYVTINKMNEKRYIGKKAFRLKNGTINAWRSYLGSGKEIKKQIKQYGKENFERYIIALGRTSDELIEMEIEYIKWFNAHENDQWLNVRKGEGLNEDEYITRPIAVYQENILITTFESIAECARHYNMYPATISTCIRKNKAYKKFGLFFRHID